MLPPLRHPLFLAGVLLAALAGTYAGSLGGGFLWDDDLHITANPTIVGPLGWREIWTSARANYFPLVLTNFRLQHELWGLAPAGYRAVTLAFHAVAALLLWRVLVQLRIPGAWLGAALWALHPVQVESVAWICELKNTQSAVFFLAAISCWVHGLRNAAESRRAYALALGLALLALLSKPSTVMLPVALLLATAWVRGSVRLRDAVQLAPFFALSAAAAAWTIWEQKYNSGAIGPEWSQTLAERFAIAARAIGFYLGKLAWPQPLIFIYPRWEPAREVAVGVLACTAVALGAWLLWRRRADPRWRGAAFAGAFFVALLFPVLGFFSVYFFRYSFVGDHFQYLASMGPLALAGAAIARLPARVSGFAGSALVAVLALLAAGHSRVFHENERLWRDTVSKNPGAIMAWLNLADTLARAERHDEAIATFRHALSLRPDDPYACNDLGCELTLVGRPEEAVAFLRRSIELKPDHAEAYSNLGNALRALGRSAEAITHYRRALELKPAYTAALNNLGAELAETGRPAEALEVFETARRLKANDAATLDNLGGALRVLGRHPEAIAQHQAALRVKPDFPEAEANLGRTLAAAGRAEEALPHFARALQLRPAFTAARSHYARTLRALGRDAEAFAQLEEAVVRAPHSAEAHLNLGTALAQSGRPGDALAYFERAAALAPELAAAQLNLGTARAGLQRWTEAAEAFARAAELQPSASLAHAQHAIALVNAGRLEAAVPAFERALRLEPTAQWHDQFAQVLRALGRNREALEQFELAAQARHRR